MTKRILTYIIALFLFAGVQEVNAQDVQRNVTTIEQQPQQEFEEVAISLNNATLHIKNAENKVVEIYNMAGVKVVTYRIDSNNKAIDLNQFAKGCYIVKVGKVARKVYLR